MALNLYSAVDFAREVLRVEQIAPSDVEDRSGTVVNGRTVRATIYGNDRGCGPAVSFGQILENADGSVLVAIRGTSDIFEWLLDAEFFQVRCGFLPGRIEYGFKTIYDTLRAVGPGFSGPLKYFPLLHQRVTTIAGHSLGGALATLTATDVAVYARGSGSINKFSAYTYASPRVGDPEFVAAYEKLGIESHRIENPGDRVPEVPNFGYEHVGEPFYLTDWKARSTFCKHHLTTYLHLMTLTLYDGEESKVFPLDGDCV